MDTAVKPIQYGRGRQWSAEQRFSVQAFAEMLRDWISFSIAQGTSFLSSHPLPNADLHTRSPEQGRAEETAPGRGS
jgi:hypothetical protein